MTLKKHFKTGVWDAETFLLKAYAAKDSGDHYHSRKLLRLGTNQFPANAKLWYELAKALRQNRTYDDATLECYKTAHNLTPGNLRFATAYADFLSKKLKFAEAEEIFAKTYTRLGESEPLMSDMGHYFQERGDDRLALFCFSRSCALKPSGEFVTRRYAEMAGIVGRESNTEDEALFTQRMAASAPSKEASPSIDNPVVVGP